MARRARHRPSRAPTASPWDRPTPPTDHLHYTSAVSGVTVTIITRNEAANIEAALASVAWAAERIVVDAESTDETVALARRMADRVEVRPWPGYGEQKNYAASLASHDWILSIDADERVTPALADEIRRVVLEGPRAAGYRIPRVSWYLGRWIRSTDWYPDYQLRLYDRRVAEWNLRRVHETVEARGPIAYLRPELQHFPYRQVSNHLATIDRYTTLAAEQLWSEQRRATLADLLLHAPAGFLRNYVLRAGFRDGTAGLILSGLNAYYVFLKFVKLWELERRRLAPAPDGVATPPVGGSAAPAPRATRGEPPAPNRPSPAGSGRGPTDA
jgi:glycosyltransferase involved in cell wall biosynthesis